MYPYIPPPLSFFPPPSSPSRVERKRESRDTHSRGPTYETTRRYNSRRIFPRPHTTPRLRQTKKSNPFISPHRPSLFFTHALRGKNKKKEFPTKIRFYFRRRSHPSLSSSYPHPPLFIPAAAISLEGGDRRRNGGGGPSPLFSCFWTIWQARKSSAPLLPSPPPFFAEPSSRGNIRGERQDRKRRTPPMNPALS